MRKKLKDITLEELAKLCQSQSDCVACPFERFCQQPPHYIFIKHQENKEIELC